MISYNANKGKVVVEFPIFITITNVQSFLGLIGYWKNYIKGYAQIAMPLFDLTKCYVVFQWNLECQKTFD